MKKYRLTILFLIISLLLGLTSFAAGIGETVNYALYTDITAYIDGVPIRSYNVDGNTVIIVEDLKDYGFDVEWDNAARHLSVMRNEQLPNSSYKPEKIAKSLVGTRAKSVLSTDIKCTLYGYITPFPVKSYNIGGYTAIYMDSLAEAYGGAYKWNNKDRSLRWDRSNDKIVTYEWESDYYDYDAETQVSKLWTFTWVFPGIFIDSVRAVDHIEYLYNFDYNGFANNAPFKSAHDDFVLIFKELAEENGLDRWDTARLAVRFVQSLAYENEVGEYPKFPDETLFDSAGDCEDTSILLAKLLSKLGFYTVLVEFDNHMGVGVAVTDMNDGYYYKHDGRNYYYIETSDWGWEIGRMPDDLKGETVDIQEVY
jgi:hypothetical protein